MNFCFEALYVAISVFLVIFAVLFFALFGGFFGEKRCGFDLPGFFELYPCLSSSVSVVSFLFFFFFFFLIMGFFQSSCF